MEVRQLVAEEGREARNLIAFHVSVDTPASRVSRKPPRLASGSAAAVTLRRAATGAPTRLRSASAGRDKRAELQARYWALLFGNLQRAIGEIYTTVEAHENLSECQEVILVLENYTRDFKSLCEWFRLKWEYDNTPPPQRPQSLTWEVRKTDFVRPESRRTHSVKSSPSVSGKNSPCMSGHNTPSGKNSPSLSTGKASPGSGKLSPRILGNSITSPKSNVEFFGSKGSISAKMHSKVESKSLKDATSRLSDIKEKIAMDTDKSCGDQEAPEHNAVKTENSFKRDVLVVEMGTAKEYPSVTSLKQVIVKSSPKSVKVVKKQDIDKSPVQAIPLIATQERNTKSSDISNVNCDNLKIGNEKKSIVESNVNNSETNFDGKDEGSVEDVVTEVSNSIGNECNTDKKTIIPVSDKIKKDSKSIASHSEGSDFKNINGVTKNKENIVNPAYKPESIKTKEDKVLDKITVETPSLAKTDTQTQESVVKNLSEPNKVDVNSIVTDIKSCMNSKPAYSQAAAKPKSASAKPDIKSVQQKVVACSLTRSKTVADIKPNRSFNIKQVQAKRSLNNRCSYPFNLTTGRPSLFDGTPASNTRIRNNINRTSSKFASGDMKMVKIEDANKRTPLKRPGDIKIDETKLIVNHKLANLKDMETYSSTDTIVTQIDRNESSESLKTLVPDPEYQLCDDIFANSIEVLNFEDTAQNDNDGWLTVKSRRLSRESKKQSKSHWANRFNQPSATASLPTLNMIESPKQENKPLVSKSETKPPKHTTANMDGEITKQIKCIPYNHKYESLKNDPQEVNEIIDGPKNGDNNTGTKEENPESKDKLPKAAKKLPKVNTLELKKPENKTLKVISTAIVRQKSDVTGMKTKSSRNKSLSKGGRNDKQKDKSKSKLDLTRNRMHSSLESLIPSGLSRSQESTEHSFDFDKSKFEFKSSFDFLEDEDRLLNRSEFLKTADPVEMSEIALMTSEIEENERKISLALDFQSDVDQRKLCEEEDLLNRQIQELQQVSDIDLDTETETETETDIEVLCDAGAAPADGCDAPAALGPLAASLEDQYEPVLAGLSWAERVDTLATLEALVARYPGRAQQLHSKLSQGIRRRGSLQETLKRYQSKQARAEHQRLELQSERSKKIHHLLGRVEDVKAAKNQLIEEKRQRMEQRLQKAAENRDQHIKDIVRKAHDEEEKLREIAFIKQLEAEHRRQDFLEQCRTHTARLRQMRRDRLRKLEEKAAREAAVGARRLALEAARRLHVSSLLERRRQRDARVVELREKTRQRRDSAARQKAADVKSRLVALAAAADADAAALRSRIRHKQDATRERHAEHLQAIRTRALQPGRQHTTSESHDAKAEEEQVEIEEPEVSKEKMKAIRKKARKLRQKLLTAGQEYENSAKAQPISALMMKNKMCRALSQLQHMLAPVTSNGHEHQETKLLPVESEANEKKKKRKNSKRKQSENAVEDDSVNVESKVVKASKGNSVCKAVEEEKTVESKVVKPTKGNAVCKAVEEERTVESKVKPTKGNSVCKSVEEDRTGESKVVKASKGNSVCSSMSDLSRQGKNDVNVASVLDATTLDRCLNELYRILDKLDKNAPERALFRQLHGVRLLSQILSLAASHDPTSPETCPVQSKSVVTCVNGILLAVSSCPQAAADMLRSTGPVHLARLLLDASIPLQGTTTVLKRLASCRAKHVEEDDIAHYTTECEAEDGRESPLVRCLAGLLCALLGSAQLACKVAALRVEADRAETKDARATGDSAAVEVAAAAAGELRQRAHQLITYMCVSGLCARAGTDSLYRLMALCCELCAPLPCDQASGGERASAWQAVRGALRPELAGARAQFAALAVAAPAPRATCAPLVALLRAAAERDHTLLQEAFGDSALEFRAAAARLLAAHAPADREAPLTAQRTPTKSQPNREQATRENEETETMLLDLITAVGFFVVNNPKNQEAVCGGGGSGGGGVVRPLCGVPAGWLCSARHRRALLPTLAALAADARAAECISAELSLQMLEEYLECEEAQEMRLVQLIHEGRGKRRPSNK